MLDHLDDIVSDLSAVHGIRDATGMEAAVFFPLVRRLAAYPSVIARRLQIEQSGSPVESRPVRRADPPPLTGRAIAELNARFGRREVGYTKVPADA